MGWVSLKEKLGCLKSTSESNFSLRDKLNSLKSIVLNNILTSIRQKAGELIDAAQAAIIKAAQAAWDKATKNIMAAWKEAKKLLADAKALFNKAKGLGTTILNKICPDALTNNPQKPKVNPASSAQSLPSSNDTEINNTSDHTKIKKSEEMAKNKGIRQLAEHVAYVNSTLNTKGALEIREIVRQNRNIHPSATSYINNLKYFQPVSEYILSEFLTYTPDKPSLSLEKWTNTTIGDINTPTAIRKNLPAKMRQEIHQEIEKSYTALNTSLKNNLSNEFMTERMAPGLNIAHSFHIAGDVQFITDHMDMRVDNVSFMLAVLFNGLLGEQTQQINYYNPIYPEISIQNDTYTVDQEPNSLNIVVDKRNNIVIPPFTEVNNDTLMPTKPEEN